MQKTKQKAKLRDFMEMCKDYIRIQCKIFEDVTESHGMD